MQCRTTLNRDISEYYHFMSYTNVVTQRPRKSTTCNNTVLLWSFYQHELTLIPAWTNNHMPKVWDEITYPFPNFNDATVEVWKRICNSSHTL